MSDVLLDVNGLDVRFRQDGAVTHAVRDVSFDVKRGETVALVGESGSGKSVTALSTVSLLGDSADISGSITYDGAEMVGADEAELRRVRGNDISFIFQEPMTSLNPLHTLEKQLAEAVALHQGLRGEEARARIIELLEQVGIPNPELRLTSYPHQLSGGQRQRVMIAMALANGPELLIADEPTTALDVTIQAQILGLLQEMQDQLGTSIIMITHDLGVIAETCDDVVVMYAGRIAEQGTVEEVFNRPRHPYTRGLLASIPRLSTPRKSRLATIEGMVPALTEMPAGCRFNNRCPHADEHCVAEYPDITDAKDGHLVACHKWRELEVVERSAGAPDDD